MGFAFSLLLSPFTSYLSVKSGNRRVRLRRMQPVSSKFVNFFTLSLFHSFTKKPFPVPHLPFPKLSPLTFSLLPPPSTFSISVLRLPKKPPVASRNLSLNDARVEFFFKRPVIGRLDAFGNPFTRFQWVNHGVHPKACGGIVGGNLFVVAALDFFQ